MSGCQKNKTEIVLDGQDTVSESETQDDTQTGNDATEDLAEAKISAEAELSEMPVETEPEMIFVDVCGAVMNPGSETTDANGVVNINTADAAALKSLSGIGDAKAQAILTYREEHGFFSSIEEIMQVPGIKESTFSAIKDKIAVK